MRAHCVRFQTFTMMSSMLPSTRRSKHQLLDCFASGRRSVRQFPASEKRTLDIGTAPASSRQPSRSCRKPTPELVRQAGFGHETDITDGRVLPRRADGQLRYPRPNCSCEGCRSTRALTAALADERRRDQADARAKVLLLDWLSTAQRAQ